MTSMLPGRDFPADCLASLTIDLRAIVENYRTIRRLAGNKSSAAVVKADAYGLGADQVAPALYHHAGCRQFFVANLGEAVLLRPHVPDAEIFVFNGCFAGHEGYFQEYRLRPVINGPEQLAHWIRSAPGGACALHFDTGINRLGFSPEDTVRLLEDRRLLKDLNVHLVMTHLACADIPDHPLNAAQQEAFRQIADQFPDSPASLANSGGVLLGPDYHFDLLRPGLLIYGGNPSPDPLPDAIRPVSAIYGKILQIRTLEKGASVGYGATWTAPDRRRIAIVNVGYADGYLRKFSNVGHAYLGDMATPVIGRVSMDMLAIDISDEKLGTPEIGQEVELLGSHITLEKASEVSTLSQYEILTGAKRRYRRIYLPLD